MERKGIILDVDGTLLDSMKFWDHAGEHYLEGKGRTPEANLEQKMFTMTMEEGASYLKKAYGLEDSITEIVEGINRTIFLYYEKEVQLKNGVPDFLENCKKRGIPMCVATSTDRACIEAAFNRLGLISYVAKIFTCSEIGIGKDRPNIYLQAAEFMGTTPENTYVFEDAYHAAKTAYEAGFQVVGVADEASASYQRDIHEVCQYYVNTLTEAGMYI
ncbi:MAG: HAD family phosphatase [Lachnospiraceae bacterium]|nr:HAD family phosphatase [Lachnospiraceae bacterium]